MPTETQKILERLNRHPEMLPRLRAILDIMDDAGGDLKKAADAELRVIEELRKLGNEALAGWGKKQAEKTAEEADSDSSLRRMGLKKQSGTAPTD